VCESLLLREDDEDAGAGAGDGGASFVSGVSSITGDHDHHEVSDVDEDEEEADCDLGDAASGEQQGPTAPPNVSSGPEGLVEQLAQMGFERGMVEKTVKDLREAGATEIDADSIIGSMLGEEAYNNSNDNGPTNHFQVPLGTTWDFVESGSPRRGPAPRTREITA